MREKRNVIISQSPPSIAFYYRKLSTSSSSSLLIGIEIGFGVKWQSKSKAYNLFLIGIICKSLLTGDITGASKHVSNERRRKMPHKT